MSQWCLASPPGYPGSCITMLRAGTCSPPPFQLSPSQRFLEAGGQGCRARLTSARPHPLSNGGQPLPWVPLVWHLLPGLSGHHRTAGRADPAGASRLEDHDSALPSPPANSTIRKPRCPAHDLKPCGRRSVHRELPFLRRCLLCPWEPVRLTMDVNLHRDPPRRHQDAPLCRHDAPRRYHNCTCPRAASAPSAVPRESSSPKQRPATVSCGTEARRGSGVRFRSASREELASSAAESQRQRPTKVYIYPVHPETPPASRDPSPGRRELRWKEDAATPAEGARQSQDMATNTSDGEAEKPAPPSGHARYFKAPEPSTQDWVYRPIKGPQWKRNQVG
ncbi:uncharacterized protein LOC142819521 isoform X1 [Pelodiscus sinensis]|uniref:uncharacterized protein LOC142819521 isoform X1 n=1 Tax=Pelodiscus sinensis TaxID=13735 RepID=UPI003F6CB0D4